MRGRHVGQGIVVLLVLLVVGTMPVAGISVSAGSTGTTADPSRSVVGITGVTYNGSGIAVRQDNQTYVWQNGSTWLRATVKPFQGTRTHSICLNATAASGNASNISEPIHQYGCKQKDVQPIGTQVTFDLERLHINKTGRYQLVVTVSGGDRVDTASVPIYVVYRDDDLDGDGLDNAAEVRRGTGLDDTDTDSDGLQDGPEVRDYGSDPTEADTDDDGLRDAVEIQSGTEPTAPDSDGDGFTDREEIREYGTDPTDPDDRPRAEGINSGESWNVLVDPMAWGGLGAVLVVLSSVGVIVYWRMQGVTIGSDGTGTGGSEEPTTAEILSPEERVHRLVEEHGGKIKQSEFVELTDWSKAKVSRILSRMEDDGEIERTRIGRENVVSHPDDADEVSN